MKWRAVPGGVAFLEQVARVRGPRCRWDFAFAFCGGRRLRLRRCLRLNRNGRRIPSNAPARTAVRNHGYEKNCQCAKELRRNARLCGGPGAGSDHRASPLMKKSSAGVGGAQPCALRVFRRIPRASRKHRAKKKPCGVPSLALPLRRRTCATARSLRRSVGRFLRTCPLLLVRRSPGAISVL